MIEIKRLKDLSPLISDSRFPCGLVEMIKDELAMLRKWSDVDNEFSMEDFNTDYFGYGHIVLLEGYENSADFIKIGVSPYFKNNIPEDVSEYVFGGTHWSRMVIIYNDSYSMSFWAESSYLKSMKLCYV